MNQEQNTASPLSLRRIFSAFLRGLRRLWWVTLLLVVLLGGALGFRAWRSYVPQYTASATFTVYVGNPLQASTPVYNSATAEQMAKTFPYILTSGVLSEVVQTDLGLTSLPAISASAVEGANLFVLSVTGSDPQLCYDVLQSVIENYPQVAEFVVGSTILTVVDESGVPTQPVNARNWIGAAKQGALIGLVIGLVLMLLYGLSKSTVMGKEDLQTVANAKYLGALPEISVKRRSKSVQPVVSLRETDSRAFREAFRLVTVRVEKSMKAHGYKTAIVCSAIPGEGKTTVAYNLALSLARHERRVLLIDCDLRNPSVYRMVRQKPCVGLSEYLCGGVSLEQILHPAQEPDAPDVIFSGRRVDSAAELLGSKAFAELLSQLRRSYDCILLDTPPCSMLSDATELAEQADCAVMVVKQNFASKASVLNSLTTLSEYGIPVVGYVLNAFSGSVINLSLIHI